MANKRALIVDDSTTAQYRLKKMLKVYALDIDVADSGEAALRYLANNVPDVVFMDHTMPGMDGLRALQVIKSHPETAIIPVIMYTSQSGDVYTGQARALGALDVVSKDTINATDLSKVMEAIHIYPIDQQEKMEAAAQAKKVEATNNVTDLDAHRIERRAPSAVAAEQARNLELRLGHLEHTLEDNRRFITARVLRELQGLRQSLRQEFNNILQNQKPPAAPTKPEVEVEPESTNSSNGFKIIFIVILLVIAFFLIQISSQLSENTEVQTLLGNQLQQVSNKDNRAITVTNPKRNSVYVAKNDYLADLAWAFNQNALLEFNKNTLDPKPLLRLHELLNRISTTGFKGSALITISVGNFCNSIDNMGVAHLAKPETNINDCVLSSELYAMNRIMDEYSNEANLLLNNLMRDKKGILSITINIQEGTETYPERTSVLTAREWNQVAQYNNRVDLVLLPDSE
jgi:CheY-like chemotaxis protein